MPLAAVLALAGCSREQKIAVLSPGAVLSAAQTGAGHLYPGDFPFPQYAGSKVIASSTSGSPAIGRVNRAVVLTSTDALAAIGAFYQQQLAQGGWKVVHAAITPSLWSVEATRDDVRASITISAAGPYEEAGTENTIQIVISPL